MADQSTYLHLPGQPGHRRANSATATDALLDKPLPSPDLRGRISIATARVGLLRRRFEWIRCLLPQGWRMTVLGGTAVAVLVLLANLILLVWSFSKPYNSSTGYRTIFEGDCGRSGRIFTYFHLVINVLSTLLLATSNTAIQCLSAPTRTAIDCAHRKGRWLDVGISSLRNWKYMDKWRKWCWVLLLLSTVPLHLLYNSVVFFTTNSNEFYALAVPSDFLDTALPPPQASSGSIADQQQTLLYEMNRDARAGLIPPTPNADCLDIYSQEIVTTHSHVLLVTKNSGQAPLMTVWYQPMPKAQINSYYSSTSRPTDWLCGNDWQPRKYGCNISQLLRDPEHWKVSSFNLSGPETSLQIDHCLVKDVPARCTVQFIPAIMGIVVLCNVIKIICFAIAVRRRFWPLITLGDALASFMEQPDPYTVNLGPLSAADVRDAATRVKVNNIRHRGGTEAAGLRELPLQLGPWKSLRKRWFSGASSLWWFLTYFLLLFLWMGVWIAFTFSIMGFHSDTLSDQLAIGFGNASPRSSIFATAELTLIGNVLLANAPQILLSIAYLSYNSLLTCMLLSHEFTGYANKRAGLRVSAPNGRYQRSSYWLTVPYTFSVPLLVLSGLLHWALSQSVFLARVDTIEANGVYNPDRSLSCLGYSSLGFLITGCLGALVFLSPLILGWIRYPAGAPAIESNSIAISAACHPMRAEASELLKYGVLPDNRVSLSFERVSPLIAGERYTTRTELTHERLQDLSPAAITPTRAQKWCGIALAFLILVKLVCTALQVVYMIEIDAYFTGSIVCAYLAARITVALVRWRKGYNLRLFGWHVAADMVILTLHIVLMIVYIWRKLNRMWISSLGWNGFITPPLPVATAAFLVSMGIEFWLWWQQHRAQKYTPPIRAERKEKSGNTF